jgi:hypothetical protein
MPFADEATISAYRDAYDAWSKQLDTLHRVFLEGEPLRPDALKGLLNRESRAFERFNAARLRLLGLEEPALDDDAPAANPLA